MAKQQMVQYVYLFVLLGTILFGGKFDGKLMSTDGNIVFVVTHQWAKLYLLSVGDGSVVTSVNLHSFGIDLPSCVRIHGEYLFVGHEDDKGAYCISKFTKPTKLQFRKFYIISFDIMMTIHGAFHVAWAIIPRLN